ncbi:MAG: DUF4956 domain-containing protein [Saprospiraceae bacterium]|nr:DUF4956 domain-containing protein [Saprospiraceae bacterium]
MLRFEEYLNQFTNTINPVDFVIALLITAGLAMVIRIYYIRFALGTSNRRRFANNFLPLALATMLIIMIVKSSIALSLGLVGALSIVRFRAAIKDPEELTYLFLVIGMGLAVGANQFVVALIAVPAILLLLWLHQRMTGKQAVSKHNRMYINIETDQGDLESITGLVANALNFVELKRMDTVDSGLSLSFIAQADDVKQIEQLRRAIIELSPNATLSVVERPDIIL